MFIIAYVACVLAYIVYTSAPRFFSKGKPHIDWRDRYAVGQAPAWAVSTAVVHAPFVGWHDLDDDVYDADVANNVGLVRLALNNAAALDLAVPTLEAQIHDESPVVTAAAYVYHLHRLVAAPIEVGTAVEMALMVYYDADYVADPVATIARISLAPALAAPQAGIPVWKAPLLHALKGQLARPLAAPPTLCRRRPRRSSTRPEGAHKME